MALLVFVAAVLVHVPAVFIRGSAVRVGDSLDHPCGCLVDSVLAAVFDRVGLSTVFVRDNTELEPPWWSLADRQCWKMSTDHPGSLSDTILISAFHDSNTHPCSKWTVAPGHSRLHFRRNTHLNVTCENKETGYYWKKHKTINKC